MPIKFRCQHCDQFLGISRAKAGAVTDCPSCGRTIRVPNLDGTVQPLPKPKLNLKDDELVKALGALATFDTPAESPAAPPNQAPVVVELAPAPAPRAVVVIDPEPAPNAPAPVPAARSHSDRGASPGGLRSGAVTEEPLDLEILPDLPSQSARYVTRRRMQFGPGVLLLGCVLSLICGVVIGRATATRGTAASTAGSDAPPADSNIAEPESPPAPPAAGESRVAGKMSYISPSGETRPDRGARVLVLPLDRKGTAKLSTAGFRVGANESDQAMLTAAVRSLGGDFVTAGEDGGYTLTVPQTGRVGVLMASRYQARENSATLPGEMTDFINAYFDRPDLLLGQVQVHFETIDAEPGRAIQLDYAFPTI